METAEHRLVSVQRVAIKLRLYSHIAISARKSMCSSGSELAVTVWLVSKKRGRVGGSFL